MSTFLIFALICCISPVVIFLLIIKLILRFSPQTNRGILKVSSYYDFLTFRGIFILISATILSIIGYKNPYFSDLLILGIFLIGLIIINLLVCVFLKFALEFNKSKIELVFSSDTFYADQSIKISKVNIPIISKLIYIFPTKIDIFAPERLGGDINFELNPEFFYNPEILLPNSKRGRYEIGPMVITFNDFFGLIQAKVFYNKNKLIHILPHYENLQSLNQKFLQKSYRDQKQIRKVINDENYYDIKEYTPQDDTRRINWKLSARTDQLLVKKPESVNLYIQDSITIFIDNSFVGTNTEIVKDAFDKQISIAATLSSYYYKHGSKVKLCYLDNSNSIQTYKADNFQSFLKFLCLLEFSNKVLLTSGQNLEVVEKGKTIRIVQAQEVSKKTLENLKEESLIYIYNSLTNPNHYSIFNNEYRNVVKNICVDIKSFILSSMLKPKPRKLHRIIFTKEYFAIKEKNSNELTEQWLSYIQNKAIISNENTVIVTRTDTLGKILS